MSKKIDKNALVAEIEKRKEISFNISERKDEPELAMYHRGKGVAYDELLDLINSIPDEPASEDLEKEIEEHSERMPMSEFTIDSEAEEFEKWAKQEFRHFYELGKNSK